MKTSVIYMSLMLLLGLFVTACGKTEISDAEHVQRAKQFQSEGDFRASLIELKNALQQNPKNAEARLLLADLYVLLGNGAAADKELQRARGLGVSGAYIEQLSIRTKLLQNKFDEVLVALADGGLESQPKFQVLRGDALFGLDKIDEAEEAFRSVLKQNPNEEGALLGLTRIALVSKHNEAAADTLQTLLKVNPENAEAWQLSGDLARLNKAAADAVTAYQRTIELLPATITTRTAIRARANLTRILLSQGQFAAAKEHVDYLLKAVPKHPMSNYLAALLAYEEKDYAKSRDYLLQTSKVSPDFLPGLFLFGSVNFSLGNLEQAEVQLARVVAERPSLTPARMMLMEIRLRQAESGEVMDILEPALAQQPQNARLLALAGQAALQEGDMETSRQYLTKAVAKQPDDSRLRAQLAMLYLAEGNDAQAIEELERAVESGKAPGREQSMLALTHLKQKHFDEALRVAQDLATVNPDSAYAQNLLGVVLGAKGDVRQAKDAFAKALQLDPEFSPAALNLVRFDVQEGNLDHARERLDRLVRQNGSDVSAMLALAQLADAENDREQAVEWLEKARLADGKAMAPRLVLTHYYSRMGELDRAREIAREVVAIDSRNPLALMALGRVEIGSRDYSAAVSTFEKAVKEAPGAQSYYSLGVAQFRANDDGAARNSLKQALKLRPEHLQTASLLVLLDVKAGRIDDALRGVEEIKRQHPKLPAGFMLEGDIHASQKQSARAVSAYARARELGGGTRALLKEVTALQASQGHVAAINRLTDWLKTHEDDLTVYYALAVAYSSADRGEDAIKEYRRLLQRAPEYVPALNDLAWLLFQDGKSGEALQFAVKAYELSPDNGPVLDTLGWIRLQQGETKPALGLLRQAAKKMPGVGDVQYHLAEALARSGKKAESRTILKRVLDTGSSFSSRQQAQQLLDRL